MLVLRAREPLEVEAIPGNAVGIAENAGVQTPSLNAPFALAKGLCVHGEMNHASSAARVDKS